MRQEFQACMDAGMVGVKLEVFTEIYNRLKEDRSFPLKRAFQDLGRTELDLYIRLRKALWQHESTDPDEIRELTLIARTLESEKAANVVSQAVNWIDDPELELECQQCWPKQFPEELSKVDKVDAVSIRKFTKEILHGDEEHNNWLLQASENFIAKGHTTWPPEGVSEALSE